MMRSKKTMIAFFVVLLMPGVLQVLFTIELVGNNKVSVTIGRPIFISMQESSRTSFLFNP
jgi:hypothetical protein